MAVDALHVILLDLRDRVRNQVGHDSIDRAAIVAAIEEDGLEGSDIGGVPEQLVARFEVVIPARTGAVLEIGRDHVRHLVEPSPFIARRKGIARVKSGISVVGESRSNEERADNEKKSERVGDHKWQRGFKDNHRSRGWRARTAGNETRPTGRVAAPSVKMVDFDEANAGGIACPSHNCGVGPRRQNPDKR
jgi:hypothetical protein